MKRLKLILVVTTIMATLLAMNAGPALADDDGCIGPRWDNGKCIGVEEDQNHHDWDDWDDWDFDRHDFFINDFEDFDDDFAELDDCEFIGWDGHDALYVCEFDF